MASHGCMNTVSELFIDSKACFISVRNRRRRMKLSMKHVRFISALVVCAAGVVLLGCLLCTPSGNPESLSDYINKHESSLIALTESCPGQYKRLNGWLGIEAVDTREDARTCFIFPWSYELPEGCSFLYYTNNGLLEFSGYSFSDTAYINGLGIDGQGYIHCTMLKRNWFLVESYIPT